MMRAMKFTSNLRSHGISRVVIVFISTQRRKDAKAQSGNIALLASLLLCVFALIPAELGAATNDLTSALQKGLFEEEANHNLDAAAQAYQSVSAQFDKDRKLAATAIFRLGEVYRKQGKTNEATAQYERIVREFSDQQTLVTLSRQNLAAMRATSKTPPDGLAPENLPPGGSATVESLTTELAVLKAQLEQASKETNALLVARLFSIPLAEVNSFGDLNKEALPRLLAYQELRVRSLESAIAQTLSQIGTNVSGAGVSVTTDDEEKEIRRIQEMIKNSPDLINTPATEGLTPLGNAARHGQLRVAKFLIEAGAKVDQRAGVLAPIHIAATEGHKAMVELLLARGADVNARDEVGRTPLHRAAQNGFQAVAEVLLANKAEVNPITSKQETPLHLAAARGYAELVQALISKGADLDPKDSSGRTPLSWSATQGHSEIVKALLAAKAKPDIEDNAGRTPLSYAAGNGHLDSVKVLLEAKADPNTGRTVLPLHAAIHGKHLAIVEALLDAGADANRNSTVNWNVNTRGVGNNQGSPWPIAPLFAALNDNNSDAVSLLLKHKADPNWKGPDGVPLVFYAIGQPEALKALLDAGANPNADIGSSGQTPLIQAVQWDNPAAVNLLLANGADKETKVNGVYSALRIATDRGQKEIANALLQAGANVNATSGGDGRTALHQAVEFRDFAMTKLLLDYKADANVRDASGLTPLDMAQGRSAGAGPLRSPTAQRPPAKLGDLAALLREHGGLSDLSKRERIEIQRPEASFTKVLFYKGTNDWNRFTLMDVLFNNYHSDGPSTSRSRGFGVFNRDDLSFAEKLLDPRLPAEQRSSVPPFPNLHRVVVVRPSATPGQAADRRVADLLDPTGKLDCTRDVLLEFGDVVEIPEREHTLQESAVGLSGDELKQIAECRGGTVGLLVRGKRTDLKVWPCWTQAGVGPVLARDESRRALFSTSDLSRVKVTRAKAAGGKTQEWVLDCSSGNNPDLWLRNGDVIEVPDKP